LKEFRSQPRRSVRQLLVTGMGFVLLWLSMWGSLGLGYWLTLLLAVPAAGFLVRLFIIQHDCGHGSLFRSRLANDLVGRVIGVLTLTPYDYWRRTHAIHHATSGNLDRRGIGDIEILTVREFQALPRWRQFVYRCYRHPLVLFGLGPAYLFILKHRLPLDLPLRHRGPWLSILATNAAIVGLVASMTLIVGIGEFAKVQLPLILLSSTAGVWLFYVQHQYEDAYWKRERNWSFYQAALLGSSYYRLPKFLQWITANISVHHVHHLNSKVPNYRLQECLERVPELNRARRITFIESLKCASLSLWDEDSQIMIRFRDLKRKYAMSAA
jgi:acyl-lipid omega-6 desaturase (Delta-12 desaturase)